MYARICAVGAPFIEPSHPARKKLGVKLPKGRRPHGERP